VHGARGRGASVIVARTGNVQCPGDEVPTLGAKGRFASRAAACARRDGARRPDLESRTMNPQKRRQIFERLRAANPSPRSELEYRTPFELLVAVVLSAQATDKGVNKATSRLFPVANTPAAFVKLGVDGLIPYISSIGLFNTKAKNVIALSQQLLDQHRGEVPRDRGALERLPGVGRKTANVVLNVAFGEPTIAVDTHIFRVANRTRLAVGKDPEAVERGLIKFTPEEFRLNAHHWLILHGRYVCVARVPKCPQCVIADLCEYRSKTRALPGANVRALPLKPPATAQD
jgi:endonuclease-3